MTRVSKFLLLGLLALFSSSLFAHEEGSDGSAYAVDKGYFTNFNTAWAACNAELANYQAHKCNSSGQYVFLKSEVTGWTRGHWHFWPGSNSSCPSGYYSVGSLGECKPIPTSEECLARPDVIHRHTSTVANPTLSPETVVKDGCAYSYGAATGLPSYNCLIAVDGLTLLCDATYTPTGSNSTDTANYNNDQTSGTSSTGGQSSTSTSKGDTTTQTDTPLPGDTTTTKTDTETTSYSDQTNVTNKSNSVDITELQGGDVTKTKTTETTTRADGSSETNVTTTYTQNDTTANTTTINPNAGTTTTKTYTIPGSSGSTTTTTTKDSSGNTTGTTSTSTGTGGEGNDNGRDEDQEGSCLDNQSCNSDIDSSGAVDGVDGLFDSAVSTVTGDNVSAGDFLGNFLEMPSGTCANPSLSHSSSLGSFNSSIDICTKTQDLRDGLGWMFFIITLFVIYRIASGT